jgi:aconitate hydratase/homoaconitate hydratase
MCLGVASEKALPGETWLSSQNRNYPNRMGQGSLAWLASAATVAASSAEMKVADPRPLIDRIDRHRYNRLLFRHAPAVLPEVRSSEPKIALEPSREPHGVSGPGAGGTVSGRVQQFGDHVDTDAIIPGEFCHLTQLPELGARAFHYVRPEFFPRAQQGQTIVVAGEGWGSGSSREQAVWALIGAGIQAVIAKSYAFIHKRNLVNEALPYLVVEDPVFFELAKENDELSIELGSGEVTHLPTGRVFKAQRPSPIVRALQKEGGLVPAIKKHGPRVFEALGTA